MTTPADKIDKLKAECETARVINLGLLRRGREQSKQLDEQSKQLDEQRKQIEELTRLLNKNSSNSHKPPSSDGIGKRRSIRKRKKRRSGKKRGGQPGHDGHSRVLMPSEHVDVVIDVFPEFCEHCQMTPPQTKSVDPFVHQVIDLQGFGGRHVTEYRCHAVDCTCGKRVPKPMDRVPSSAFGSGLCATVCLLSGTYQLSRRQVTVVLKEIFGIDISLGSVSNIEGRMSDALKAASEAAMAHVESAAVKHTDETSWIRDFERCSAWVFACAMVSVFRIAKNGTRKTFRKLFGRQRGVLVSDRASVFLFWSMKMRQICWAHLLRTFIDFSQRDGPAAAIGQELIDNADLVFRYWRDYKSKKLTKKEFVRLMTAVRDGMKPCLQRAAKAKIPYVSGSCENMLSHWDAMWTFMTKPGVEPTNNHAERELRRFVLWRKRCFGSQSDRGDRFAERIMTVTHTIRKQGGRPLGFLKASYVAMLESSPAPSLLANA